SRICVKNLPKYITEDRLREFFSQKGEVTDAKLLRTKDGKSRQFGFIGYRTEQEAKEALKYFNSSYLDTSRINCEIARKVGDPNIPRPWSRYSLKQEENLTEVKKVCPKNGAPASSKGEKKSGKKVSGNDDHLLQEFLQVMQPRVKSKLWANDSLTSPNHEQTEKAGDKNTPTNVLGEEKSKHRSLGSQAAEKSSNLAHDEVISDMDYFKSRVKKKWSDSESSDEEDCNDNNGEDAGGNHSMKKSSERQDGVNPKVQHDALKREPSEEEVEQGSSEGSESEMIDSGDPPVSLKDDKNELLETGRVFIRNLPYSATEDELEEHFSKFGNVSQVHLVVDKDTKQSKGIAYVVYTLPESAARALEELDNSIFQGRLLHIMPAKQKNISEKQESNAYANESSKTFKQRRENERKASEASGNTQAWNSLFMRPDTVVENIARKFGVSKSDLLEREADDLAVRIALGETQVIAETKKALVNAGVNLDSLEEFARGKADGMKQSNHVILVKNLPYGSSEGELAKMFGKFGSLDKIILPPTKTLALAVFIEPAEARKAFRGLAYKRYKDAPLYLEWAPGEILSETSTSVDDANNISIVGEHEAKRVLLEQHVEGIADTDIDPERIESRSLFVKNLNFKTSDESLRKHFSQQMKEGKVVSVRVKKHLKNGKNVSMGFGFLEFDSVELAVNVCRDFQGTVLDGHALILQLCHAKKDEQLLKKVDRDRSSTKLIVRNVAFEATEKELRQLFSPFGQIKSLRLPMRFGKHRGFGFVEYVTKQEAHNALQALSSTHLYGRHLVLERAKEGESLEELRARTAAQFSDGQDGLSSTKLSKKRKHMAVLDEGSVKFGRIAD
ncbi:Multiple RNA-binding domain-containing protein, partial [Actinidia chinensis var. chinensis]